MERAMYFEANRSSRDGLIAVGSVVMSRVESGQYPRTVCGVVGQRNQFAPDIMTRRMAKALELLCDPALDALVDGESRFADLPVTMAALAEGRLAALSNRSGGAQMPRGPLPQGAKMRSVQRTVRRKTGSN